MFLSAFGAGGAWVAESPHLNSTEVWVLEHDDEALLVVVGNKAFTQNDFRARGYMGFVVRYLFLLISFTCI